MTLIDNKKIEREPVKPEILGKNKDSFGRDTDPYFQCSKKDADTVELENKDIESIASTEAIELVKHHLKNALGHEYFELDELDNEKRNDKWIVDTKINYLFRDKKVKKRFVIKDGVIVSVEQLDQ